MTYKQALKIIIDGLQVQLNLNSDLTAEEIQEKKLLLTALKKELNNYSTITK